MIQVEIRVGLGLREEMMIERDHITSQPKDHDQGLILDTNIIKSTEVTDQEIGIEREHQEIEMKEMIEQKEVEKEAIEVMIEIEAIEMRGKEVIGTIEDIGMIEIGKEIEVTEMKEITAVEVT
jgi:hypothetical protein